MSNNLFQFNFEHDLQPTENSYPISDCQWVYINDQNANNYSNGYINFSNISVIGSNVEKQYLMVSRVFNYSIYHYCCTYRYAICC